jgi:hypothetical protein
LKRGAGIVHSLARGPPIDSDGWINPAVSLLCDLARAGAGTLVGDAISNAYVACSYRVSSRLGDIRPFIGIATLRIFGETYLRSELQSEHLGCMYSILPRMRIQLNLPSQPLLPVCYIGYVWPQTREHSICRPWLTCFR